MAEKHYLYTNPGTWGDILWNIADFVLNRQSGILEFASEGGNTAHWNGTNFNVPTSAASFGDNSYLVIQPVVTPQSGQKWQVKFVSTDVSNHETSQGKAKCSFRGGWTTADPDWATHGATHAVSGLYQMLYSRSRDGGRMWLSCGNLDTWTNTGGTQKYTYIRVIMATDAGYMGPGSLNIDHIQGTYCGGYIPLDVETNTNPCVLLNRKVADHDQGDSWGYVQGNANYCVLPANYAATAAGGLKAGFIGEGNANAAGWSGGGWSGGPIYSHSPDGLLATGPMWLYNDVDSFTMGSFGKYTMLKGHPNHGVTGSIDSEKDYMFSQSVVSRFKLDA